MTDMIRKENGIISYAQLKPKKQKKSGKQKDRNRTGTTCRKQ